ncbi:MAG TPA: histidine kinase dimerization/phosphoacceptor domain -containing protein [Anaeromyxobacteraceae bacterium]
MKGPSMSARRPTRAERERYVSESLRQTEAEAADAMFRWVLEAAPDAMMIARFDSTIALVNGQLHRMFGYEREELLGKPVEVLVPDRFRGIHLQHRERYFGEPRTRPMGAGLDLLGRRKDGSEFPVEISLSPMRTEDGTLVTAAIRDISERKLVETRLRTSLKEKEVLLKEIHHRVKNSLQIVSSMLNLQMRQITSPQVLELLKQSQTRIRSIALLHEKLYQSPSLAQPDVAGYLRGLATGLAGTYGVTDEVVLSVRAQELRLGMDATLSCGLIVNELLSNALKHAFPGGRRGKVGVALRREGEEVVLEVADDGVGFPSDLDFHDVGTLGLKLVCILTEQIRGTIELERREGTRFVIRFAQGADL